MFESHNKKRLHCKTEEFLSLRSMWLQFNFIQRKYVLNKISVWFSQFSKKWASHIPTPHFPCCNKRSECRCDVNKRDATTSPPVVDYACLCSPGNPFFILSPTREIKSVMGTKSTGVGYRNHITLYYTISRHSWLQNRVFAQVLLGYELKCFKAPTCEWTLLDFAQSCHLHKVASRWSLTLHVANESLTLSLSFSVCLSLCLFVSLPLSLSVTSVTSWKQLHTNCASPWLCSLPACLPASQPVFSAPLNLIAASL